MSNRKQRSRLAEVPREAKPSPSRGSEDKPVRSPLSPHPPKRHATLLSASVLAFAIWVCFLAYVALFR
ncbi:MAG: hypothetical protein WD070_03615 [Pirellulaceae bacterium]